MVLTCIWGYYDRKNPNRVKGGRVEDMKFPGGTDEKACGISKGVQEKLKEFPSVSVFLRVK